MQFALPPNATADEAKQWLQDVTREFGGGFHPDTPAEDYVTPSGERLFSAEEAQQFNASLAVAFGMSDDPDWVYSVCMEVVAELMPDLFAGE